MEIVPGMFVEILKQFGLLLGYAAAVSLLVNIGKLIKLIKDGTADKWVAGLDLLGVVALYVVRLINPDFDVFQVDTILGELAVVGTFIFSFVGMLLESKLTYFATRGLPVVGTSNSATSTVVMAVSSPGVSTEVVSAEATIIDTARHPE